MVIWALVSVPWVIESMDKERIDPVVIKSFAEAMEGAAFVGLGPERIVTVTDATSGGETDGVIVINGVASRGGFSWGVQEIKTTFNRIKKATRTLHLFNLAKRESRIILFIPLSGGGYF
jgi:hypothetical protein